jgi:cardiolipin synthase
MNLEWMDSMRRRAALALVPLLFLVTVGGCGTVSQHYNITAVELGEPSFFPTMEGNTRAPIVGGNRVDILLNGDELFPALLEAISGAQRSITFTQYVYEKGAISERIAEALAERCRAGVGVNVLLDYTGSLKFPDGYAKTLKTAGCHLAWFHPLNPWQPNRFNKRTHRRLVVVDGRVGFTGGFGISQKWTGDGRVKDNWRDTQARVEGPAVEYLQAAFAEDWRQATGIVLAGEAYFPRLRPVGSTHAQVVASSPAGGSSDAYLHFLLALGSARRTIFITNPYFVPDARMTQALLDAVARGVRVVVLIPGAIDHPLVREAGRRDFGPLLRAGIEIYEYQAALLHAKTMVIDGVFSTLGSTNLDNRSFALNQELNLTVYDREVGRRMEQVFAADLAHATAVSYKDWKHRGLRARFYELIALPIKNQL